MGIDYSIQMEQGMGKSCFMLRIIVGKTNHDFPPLPPSTGQWKERKVVNEPVTARAEIFDPTNRFRFVCFAPKSVTLRVARSLVRPSCFLHRERGEGRGREKKRSFCNQDTVHRTCERSRIDHCSWHARFVIAIRHREIELAFEILQAAN